MPDDQFSQQDIQDLVQIRQALSKGDPRADKIDRLLAAAGGQSKPAAPNPVNASFSQATSIGAQPKPRGFGETLARFAENAISDVKFGSDQTFVGKTLKALGAPGTQTGGTSTKAADFLASPITGPLRFAQGAGQQLSGKIAEGTGNIIGGALEASQIPLAFTGAPSEAISNAIPSKVRAGRLFQGVAQAARDIPIDTSVAQNAALEAKAFSQTGARLPKVINDFLKRTLDAENGSLSFDEARNFFSNAGALTAEDAAGLTKVGRANMKRLLVQFRQGLGSSLTDAADQVGKADEYLQAIREFRQASNVSDIGEFLAKKALPAGLTGVGLHYLIGQLASGR